MTELNEFLSQTFYGNTILTWSISLGIILFSTIIGKIVYWFFSKFVRVLTRKTKNNLDDIVVDMIEEPLVFTIIVTGIWLALSLLTLPKLVSVAITHSYSMVISLLVGWLVARLFDAIYQQYLLPWADRTENDLDDQLLPVLGKGIKMSIWILAIIIGLNNAGYDVGALIAGLGIGGLALAMAAKDTVSNVFGGFTIFTDKPFRLKDRIIISGYDGIVQEIGIRSTRLRTLTGRLVTIPNAKFADAPVENISAEPSRKITLELGLTYDTTPDKMQEAMNILQAIADANSDTEEKTVIYFSSFGDFAMTIKFIYYIKKGCSVAMTQSDMNMAILKQFNDHKLEFAFPTQTLYNIAQN